MNYYIQGSKHNAKRIKETFERLGFKCSPEETFDDPNKLFFTSMVFNKVEWCCAKKSEATVIRSHQGFLELPIPKFNIGELVVWNNCLGRIEEISGNQAMYRVGNNWVPKNQIRLADHRDEVRILKGDKQ